MTNSEFVAWLNEEVAEGRMTTPQRDDLLAQKNLFDQNRTEIESGFANKIVGFVAGQQRVNTDLHSLLAAAKEEFPGSLMYFEPVGFDLFEG
jgi:hypothetical protein